MKHHFLQGEKLRLTLPYLPSIGHKNKPYNKLYFLMVWPWWLHRVMNIHCIVMLKQRTGKLFLFVITVLPTIYCGYHDHFSALFVTFHVGGVLTKTLGGCWSLGHMNPCHEQDQGIPILQPWSRLKPKKDTPCSSLNRVSCYPIPGHSHKQYTVQTPVSNHPKCQANVVAYGRWSLTRA